LLIFNCSYSIAHIQLLIFNCSYLITYIQLLIFNCSYSITHIQLLIFNYSYSITHIQLLIFNCSDPIAQIQLLRSNWFISGFVDSTIRLILIFSKCWSVFIQQGTALCRGKDGVAIGTARQWLGRTYEHVVDVFSPTESA
jgi:hypothetical protein